jgi:hypothetical protein
MTVSWEAGMIKILMLLENRGSPETINIKEYIKETCKLMDIVQECKWTDTGMS